MATLTSTGAVNLTSSTNWSPAQTPAAGDDLVVGAHTLTLDADFTGAGALNTITFNSASSKISVSGTTRIIQATNGYIASSSNTSLINSLTAGVSLTMKGVWSVTANSFRLASSGGGDLTLATIGDDQSSLLWNGSNNAGICSTSTWTAGTLTTIGRFYTPLTNYNDFVAMSGGTWIHQSIGLNTGPASNNGRVCTISGTATVNWKGSLVAGGTSASVTVPGFYLTSSSTSHVIGQAGDTFLCAFSQNAIYPIVAISNGACELVGRFSCQNGAACFWVIGGTLRYRNQSVTIPGTDAFIAVIDNGAVDFSGLNMTVPTAFSVIGRRAAMSITVDSNTVVTCTGSGKAVSWPVSNLDSKIIVPQSGILAFPAVQNVAAGTSYGYAASPLTGTGLIMDPATLAAAVRNGVNVTVNPLVGTVSSRVLSDKTMNFYRGEVINTTITVVDANRQPVNLSGMTLRLVFENGTTGVDIASVTSFTITGAGNNNATFAVPSAVTTSVTSTPHNWSLRDSGDGNRVIAMGTVVVRSAATLD